MDEVLISVMKAPYTYTAEDIVEINCHGGMIVTKKILELVLTKNGEDRQKVLGMKCYRVNGSFVEISGGRSIYEK